MEWHFGHNCQRFIPSLQKCRKLIENYSARADLRSDRWVEMPELLLYVGGTREALLTRIRSGEITAQRQKTGPLLFKVSGSWDYDDCFLKANGGQCHYFEAHDGLRITCMEDLKRLRPIHPNTVLAPSQDEIEALEGEVGRAIDVPDADLG